MENENVVPRPRSWVRRLVNTNEDIAAKSGTRIRRLGRIVVWVSLSIMAIYVVAGMVWRASGSNKWEFIREENGVKLYSLKAPGSNLIQVKGIVRVHSTLGGIIKLLSDPSTCDDYGCIDAYTIERVDHWLDYGTFKIKPPFPFKTREFVTRTQIHQDPRSKEILVVVAAAPHKSPPSNCCIRVTEMNNTWRLTPVEGGQVEFEYIQNMNEGGFIPDLLLNIRRPVAIVNILSRLQGMLDRRNHKIAKLDYIQEK